MKWARTFHTLTVLPDGDVLAIGGQSTRTATRSSQRRAPARDLAPGDRHVDVDGLQPAAARLPQHVAAAARRPHPAGRQRPPRRLADAQRDRRRRSSRRRTCTRARARRSRPRRRAWTTAARSRSHTPDAATIAKVSLVRTGSVTHNFNMDQRWQELTFTQARRQPRDRRADVRQRRAARHLLRLPHRRPRRPVRGRDRSAMLGQRRHGRAVGAAERDRDRRAPARSRSNWTASDRQRRRRRATSCTARRPPASRRAPPTQVGDRDVGTTLRRQRPRAGHVLLPRGRRGRGRQRQRRLGPGLRRVRRRTRRRRPCR